MSSCTFSHSIPNRVHILQTLLAHTSDQYCSFLDSVSGRCFCRTCGKHLSSLVCNDLSFKCKKCSCCTLYDPRKLTSTFTVTLLSCGFSSIINADAHTFYGLLQSSCLVQNSSNQSTRFEIVYLDESHPLSKDEVSHLWNLLFFLETTLYLMFSRIYPQNEDSFLDSYWRLLVSRS